MGLKNINERSALLTTNQYAIDENLSDSLDDDDSYPHPSNALTSDTERLLTASRKSTTLTQSIMLTLVEKLSHDQESTLALAVCNIMPILQGSAVFSLPYAFLVGGTSFLPTGIVICLLAEVTCHLLIDCLYEVSPRSQRRKRVHGTYADLAFECWGSFGSKIVNFSNFLNYFMNNVASSVLLGKSMYNMLHTHSTLTNKDLAMIFSVIIIPFLFIRKLSVMAYMGLVGSLSVVVACLVSLVIFFKCYADWSVNYNQFDVFKLEDYPLAIGILLYSLSLAPTLPEIEGSMRNKKDIRPALRISFTFSTIFKLAFGILGALTFGKDTQQLISTNTRDLSAVANYITSVMLIFYAVCNTAYFCYMINNMTDEFMINKVSLKFAPKRQYNIPWTIFSRLFWLVAVVAVGLVMPFFALVSGTVGALVGSFTCLVAPVIFHLMLKWRELSRLRKFSEIVLLAIGVFIGVLASYSSLKALALAVKQHHNL